MMLFTKQIENKLIENHKKHKEAWNDEHPEYVESKAVVKLFNPTGAGTWYLSEYNPETNEAFGVCVIHEAEMGYVDMNELKSFKGQFGLGIERDKSFPISKLTLKQCQELAKKRQEIESM